jgi:sulfide:quinone oxidoreductase
MAHILILGGGFGGVVAAERLAENLAPEHQITLVSRSNRFVFYPALVRVAFGRADVADVSFDLREAMLSRRVRFIRTEAVRVDFRRRIVTLARGEFDGELSYDHLIIATGRRLATEQVAGFFEHAHHLLSVEAALRFGEAVRRFQEGRAVIGYCPGARLSVPVFETAFALARHLEERQARHRARITVVTPEQSLDAIAGFGGEDFTARLRQAMEAHGIELLPDFSVRRITEGQVWADDQSKLSYDLLMLVPPFAGASIGLHHYSAEITDYDGFIRTDRHMRVREIERAYAVGDCVSFSGPKMGHMAVRQAEVAAANVQAEVEGREPSALYTHEARLIIDTGDADALYLHQGLWEDEPHAVRQGRFWSWAKRVHEAYWQMEHR